VEKPQNQKVKLDEIDRRSSDLSRMNFPILGLEKLSLKPLVPW